MTTFRRAIAILLGLAGMVMLAGCATSNAAGPGPRPMPSGMTCNSARAELAQLDRRGTRSKIEAVSSGRKVSAKDQQEVDRYNYLLNVYLGARCHA